MTALASPTPTVLEVDPEVFREKFDKQCFPLSHGLSDSPLFETEALLQLAKTMATDPRDVYFDVGDVRVDQRWDDVPANQWPIEELLERIETANAWIILRRAHDDPAYGELLDTCMSEIESLSGRDLKKATKVRNAIVFINSPNRISSYHIDRECNFLLQIRGHKTISIFDREDREVLPEAEIEKFWAVDNNAAIYKPQLQERARIFTLGPGDAVHIPVNAPHWVRNGPETSVSISINFHYKDELLGDVYRTNYWLRRLGFGPTPPRRSATIDGIKGTLYGSVRNVRATALKLVGKG